jgi:FKBP-type peptidyl-prolyl cis-trans isomerase
MKISPWACAAALCLNPMMPNIAQAADPITAAKKSDNPLLCNLQTSTGLGYSILIPGDGDAPAAEDAVSVNYTGRLATNGTQFDAGKDSKFAVGGVIPGFAEGLQLMKPGAKYRLCIPSALAYADRATGSIPANSDLVFEVDLLSVIKKPVPVAQIIPPAERICDMKTASGLGYKELNSGVGNMPGDGDVTLVNITVYEPATGKVLDGRDWQQIPVQSALPGLAEGLRLMNNGASFRLCVPGGLLGQAPAADGKAPDDINFHIELVDTKKIADIR